MNPKLFELQNFAMSIHKAMIKDTTELDPTGLVHIKLPAGYWHERVNDMLHDARRDQEWHSQMNAGSFEICGVTFWNDRQKPDWLK